MSPHLGFICLVSPSIYSEGTVCLVKEASSRLPKPTTVSRSLTTRVGSLVGTASRSRQRCSPFADMVPTPPHSVGRDKCTQRNSSGESQLGFASCRELVAC